MLTEQKNAPQTRHAPHEKERTWQVCGDVVQNQKVKHLQMEEKQR